MIATDRYQSGPTGTGVMPTAEWWQTLRSHVDGPLGSVLDVGCAEGVMACLAASGGAESVVGLDVNAERIAAARMLARFMEVDDLTAFEVAPSTAAISPVRTVTLSMIAHWIGRDETVRLAGLASRNLLVVFREANEGYAIPANGTWFPTLDELDAAIPGVRTSETLLMTQDNGKNVWAVTYRTDIRVFMNMVTKRREPSEAVRAFGGQPTGEGYITNLADGHDLHGDPPFRPMHGKPLATLTMDEQEAVRTLVREIAASAIATGYYPTDLSPRNIIVGRQTTWQFPQGRMEARLVDLDEIERHDGTVAPEYLPIWQTTLSAVGWTFDGRLADLL